MNKETIEVFMIKKPLYEFFLGPKFISTLSLRNICFEYYGNNGF